MSLQVRFQLLVSHRVEKMADRLSNLTSRDSFLRKSTCFEGASRNRRFLWKRCFQKCSYHHNQTYDDNVSQHEPKTKPKLSLFIFVLLFAIIASDTLSILCDMQTTVDPSTVDFPHESALTHFFNLLAMDTAIGVAVLVLAFRNDYYRLFFALACVLVYFRGWWLESCELLFMSNR